MRSLSYSRCRSSPVVRFGMPVCSLLGLVVCGVGCTTQDAPPAESPDATIAMPSSNEDAAPIVYTPSPFTDTHDAHDVLVNRCSHVMAMVGSEPEETGRYPLAIFLVGTYGHFDAPGITQHVLPTLASQGFVAASIEYENSALFGLGQNCSMYRSNASCLVRNENDYVAGERKSALARLCGRAKADCSKGVVVFGHSQGAMTSLQLFVYPPAVPPVGEPVPRLVAAAPMGIGPVGYLLGLPLVPLEECIGRASLAVDQHKLLVVNGENDGFFNGPKADAAGGQTALEAVTGRACTSPTWDCRGPDGDGYVLVKRTQTSTGSAQHDYMDGYLDGGIGAFAEPQWISPQNTDAWGLASTARWLKAQTAP
jgi:hypothetical protein